MIREFSTAVNATIGVEPNSRHTMTTTAKAANALVVLRDWPTEEPHGFPSF